MALLKNPRRPIILASASPRRKHLFQLIFNQFEIRESKIDEQFLADDAPETVVRKLAFEKARDVAQSIENGLIIGADSVVVVDDQILGKPRDNAEARQMLGLLSDKSHQVYTGFAILEKPGARAVVDHVVTTVKFKKLMDWEITRYIEIGEPLDKAGAYGIQNEAALFIEEIDGCYYNVMGLPVNAVYEALLRFV